MIRVGITFLDFLEHVRMSAISPWVNMFFAWFCFYYLFSKSKWCWRTKLTADFLNDYCLKIYRNITNIWYIFGASKENLHGLHRKMCSI